MTGLRCVHCLNCSGSFSASSHDAAARRGMYSSIPSTLDCAHNSSAVQAPDKPEGSIDALGSPRILLRPSPLDSNAAGGVPHCWVSVGSGVAPDTRHARMSPRWAENKKDWSVVPNGRIASSSSSSRAPRYLNLIWGRSVPCFQKLEILGSLGRELAWLLDSAQCTHSPFLTACPPHANCSVDMSYRPPQSASSTKRGLFGTNGDVDSAGCRTALFATIPFDAIRVCYYTIRRHTLTQAHASTRKHMQSTCLLESLTHMSTYTNSRTHTQMT